MDGLHQLSSLSPAAWNIRTYRDDSGPDPEYGSECSKISQIPDSGTPPDVEQIWPGSASSKQRGKTTTEYRFAESPRPRPPDGRFGFPGAAAGMHHSVLLHPVEGIFQPDRTVRRIRDLRQRAIRQAA